MYFSVVIGVTEPYFKFLSYKFGCIPQSIHRISNFWIMSAKFWFRNDLNGNYNSKISQSEITDQRNHFNWF